MKRLPQFDVGIGLVARASAAGAVVSLLCWALIGFLPYLRYFLSILVGVAVGEAMSRLARRRVSIALQGCAVLVVAGGAVVVEAIRFGGATTLTAGGGLALAPLAFPILVASALAVIKLR